MRGRRIVAGAAGLAVLLGFASAPPVGQTDAYFTDGEYATATQITAGSLVAPSITSCTVSTLLGLGLVFVNAKITWTSQYPLSGVQLSMRPPGGTDVVVPASNYVENASPGGGLHSYTVTVNDVLLQNVLQGVLGSTTILSVRAVAGTSWRSVEVTKTLSVGGLLGLAGDNSCT